MKLIYPSILTFFVLSCIACDKQEKDANEKNNLLNTVWMASLIDDNPDTNPPGDFGFSGDNLYFPWLACHLDDSFTFTAGKLIIDSNGTDCEEGTGSVFEAKDQSYTYNSDRKQLTIETVAGNVTLQVYEVNQLRLKVGFPIPMGGNMVFLFKRK